MKKDKLSDARLLAVRILTKVEKEGAYANLLLRSQLADLKDKRDRNLVTALVNGVLKHKLTLDYALRFHLTKPMSALPHEIRAALRVGAFQILYMDKIPEAAAINESVELAKRLHKNFAALVNGVLRQTAAAGWNFKWPDPGKEPVKYLSVRYSHPEWIVKRWLKMLGPAEAEVLLSANNEASPTHIRVNTLKTTRDELVKRLEQEGVKATPSPRVPDALVIEDFGPVEKLPAYQQGWFSVQDESSQLVARVLGVKPDDSVLDVCSAPGGKTTHMAQLMQNTGRIAAMDLYPHKLALVDEAASRLGIDIIETVQGDARTLAGVAGPFNCVLVDAPCSGLGVIRRRADLRWQKREDEIAELPQLQLEILLKAADHVLPGGHLVYSTCTTEPEENFEVVKAFRRLRPEFAPVDISGKLEFLAQDKRELSQMQKGMVQILPHRHNMDGFFIAKFRRQEQSFCGIRQ